MSVSKVATGTFFLVFIICQFCDATKSRFDALPMVDPGRCAPLKTCDLNAKYRTIDGSCSNPEHPHWATSAYPYARFQAAKFYDGKEGIRRAVGNKALPLPKRISYDLFPDRNTPDKTTTLNFVQWCQVAAHDITRLNDRNVENPLNGFQTQCCTADHQKLPKTPAGCMPLDLTGDPFYRQFNATCLFFVRGNVSDLGICGEYPVEVANQLSSVIDGSFVYGYNQKKADSLRTFINGKLKNYILEDGREFCPQTETPEVPCLNKPPEFRCYDAGDVRVNLVSGMSLYHVMFLRMHNHFCDELLELNPTWNDEKLYQESRRIVGAIVQHITYKHFLPLFLGKEYSKKKRLTSGNHLNDCVSLFNPDINPTTCHEMGAAALRSVHSMTPREILMVNSSFEQEDFILVEDCALQPYCIERPGAFDKLVRGMTVQPNQKIDHFYSVGQTKFWFKQTQNNVWGTSVPSLDTSRGRDVGLPTYNDMREIFGWKRAKEFKDFQDVMSHESIRKLQGLYESPEDVDLLIGGIMEEHAHDAQMGPTFRRIMGEQFYRYKTGDRFWYENCGLPSSFTKAQLKAIYKVTNAWIICNFSDNITAVPKNTFLAPSESNPIVPCRKIPGLDLSPWKE